MNDTFGLGRQAPLEFLNLMGGTSTGGYLMSLELVEATVAGY